jgi:hypothetical protein
MVCAELRVKSVRWYEPRAPWLEVRQLGGSVSMVVIFCFHLVRFIIGFYYWHGYPTLRIYIDHRIQDRKVA